MNLLRRSYNFLISRKRRFFSSVILLKAKSKSNVQIIRAGKSSGPISVSPNFYKDLFIMSPKKDEYRLKISHFDHHLQRNHKGLWVQITVASGIVPRQVASEFGVNLSEKIGAYAYMGGGRIKENGIITQIKDIKSVRYEKWIRLRIYSPSDRYLNLDTISLISAKDAAQQMEMETQFLTTNIFVDRPEILSCDYVLYADININSVDGSSIWYSSMASILAHTGSVLVVLKSDIVTDIVTSNIQRMENVTFISPKDFDLAGQTFSIKQASDVIKFIDSEVPSIRRIVVRGLDETSELSKTRQFYQRLCAYLTNFYEIGPDGPTQSNEVRNKLREVVVQSRTVLTQTRQISNEIRKITGFDFNSEMLPPPILSLSPEVASIDATGSILIGYGGKITPNWGVDILLDWTERLRKEGHDIKLVISAPRISEGVGSKRVLGFADNIKKALNKGYIEYYDNLNRESLMSLMAKMNYVWCYRPEAFENKTLELSTKLVEMTAIGQRCICYPNDINRELLGDDFLYYTKNYNDFKRLIVSRKSSLPEQLSKKISQSQSIDSIAKRLEVNTFPLRPSNPPIQKNVLVSGHDYKFIDAYISELKSNGISVKRDRWNWETAFDIEATLKRLKWADVVFCEWGLGNAVWHSKNKIAGTKLIVRIHLQEVNPRAQKFGHQIDVNEVDQFVFVSDAVRLTAIEMFNWPAEKTMTISNYVLPDEYTLNDKGYGSKISLGMVGIIPQRKRFDRAIDLLDQLLKEGYDAELNIKGPRPEDIDWMHAPGRREELDYYYAQYARLEANPDLSGRVHFQGWGNDMALWYKGIDVILSPSDFESFHYALADGVLSGCLPIIWPWDEAEDLYKEEWIVKDSVQACERVARFNNASLEEKDDLIQSNREFIISRYGKKLVFSELSKLLNSV